MQEAFMRQTLDLALASVQKSVGGPFGAVVVQNGRVVGQGTNQVTTANDPTAHAEIVAIRQAAQALRAFRLEGCEIYASCEPCPMCLAAIYWARIDRVYYAATRADAAATGFDDALIYQDMSLPITERRLPMIQLLPGEAQAALEAWKVSPTKVPY
jgi:tRNA(Arg) A34 adenosine deaminase TadA